MSYIFLLLSFIAACAAIVFLVCIYSGGLVEILYAIFDGRPIAASEGDTYMHRWYILRRKSFAIFLHKFVRSDYDRALHCHPWDFLVIPIWRGYIEHNVRMDPCIYCGGRGAFTPQLKAEGRGCSYCKGTGLFEMPNSTRVYPIIGTRFRRAEYKHRVELLTELKRVPNTAFMEKVLYLPSWSIFIRFRQRKHWGFFCPNGWVPFKEGVQDHCNS